MSAYQNETSSQPCGCDPGCEWICEHHEKDRALDKALAEDGRQRKFKNAEVISTEHGACVKWGPLKGIGGAPTRATTLPTGSEGRKTYPIASGVLDYFPDAIAAISHLSWKGNEQHNPGQPLHWNRAKSADEADTMMRHFMQRGTVDDDGVRHSAKVAWRALALLQKEIENEQR